MRVLPQWHQWQGILELCHLIVMTRPGISMFGQSGTDFNPDYALFQERMVEHADSLKQRQYGQILLQSTPLLDISSTQIRDLLSSGKSIRYLLPENVRESLYKYYAI